MGEKNKGERENKKKGVSLIYVLVVLSMISVFSVSFIHFVREKTEIVSLKSGSKNSIPLNYLINKENENAEKIMLRGIMYNGILIFPENKEQYFDSKIEMDLSGNTVITKIIFLPENTGSIGNFKISRISDGNGSEYRLPLDLNTVYNDLEILYTKKILGKELRFVEKISFKRINPTLVEITLKEKEFLKDDN